MNIMRFKFLSLLMLVILLTTAISCKEDEPPLPNNEVSFGASELGFSDDESQTTITINITRAADADKVVIVSLVPTGVTYGVEFTTDPVAVSNSITVTIPAGETEASFEVTKADGIFLDGDESISFEIGNVETTGLVLGKTKTTVLSFSAIVSAGSELTLQGIAGSEAGSSAANSVFVDFSSNKQSSVLRSSWDLGFYAGADFRVILNNTTSAGAKVTTATDLANVGAADTVGLTLAVSQGSPSPDHYAFFDALDGSLSGTVIPEISATANDNKVVIINRGTGGGIPARPWIKAKITRNANGGYTIEYGGIKQTSGFTRVDIAKDAADNFTYLSFTTGTVVRVEPKKAEWDFTWSYSLYQTTFSGNLVPYNFSDIVAINTQGGVQVAEVLTSVVSYDNYGQSNISTTVFSSDRSFVGSKWRTPTSDASPHVLSDRFYVIQDPAGNVYKLKFVRFHGAEGGTRGKPEIAYTLVKKADD